MPRGAARYFLNEWMVSRKQNETAILLTCQILSHSKAAMLKSFPKLLFFFAFMHYIDFVGSEIEFRSEEQFGTMAILQNKTCTHE